MRWKRKKKMEDSKIGCILNKCKTHKKNKSLLEDKIVMRTLIELRNNNTDLVETESVFDKNYITYGFDGDRNKVPSLKEYLEIIRPYLKNVTINLMGFDE